MARTQAALLKPQHAATRTQVVAAEFFLQQFVAMHNPYTAFDVRLRWISLTAFTHQLTRFLVEKSYLVRLSLTSVHSW